MKNTILTCLALIIGTLAYAQSSPIGTWKTVDDKTGKEKSYVKIYKTKSGKLQGDVVKILTKGKEDAKCVDCKGENKNKPITGMTILWGLEKDGNEWDGGKILDPNSGKTYSCEIEMEGNNTLKVRGFLGISLIGRTQTWTRVEE